MTRNQIAYHTLQEDRRKNRISEAQRDIENAIKQQEASTKAKEANIRANEAAIKQQQADTEREAMKKKVNENTWLPLKTISDNAAKVLGGIL